MTNTNAPWTPKVSLAQTEKILCSPGGIYEIETRLVDGQLQRVYKNLWPTLRYFWMDSATKHGDATYLVYENQRFSYRQALEESLRVAAMYRDAYGIVKGDRVGICSRNYAEYLIAFWACHLIGAVAVLINAWLPLPALRHCIAHTGCKLVIVDSERATLLEKGLESFASQNDIRGVLVVRPQDAKGTSSWKGIKAWNDVLSRYTPLSRQDVEAIDIQPEDNATIFFTSGTTGLPKGVLSTQRMFLTNIPNVMVPGFRAAIRSGEPLPQAGTGPQRGVLIAVPLFHVTGLTSQAMLGTVLAMKIVMMRKWSGKEATRLIKEERLTTAGGVPSMVLDLADADLDGYPFESLSFGGAAVPKTLIPKTQKNFPATSINQGYGLTETNSVAASLGGGDFLLRPESCGLPTPVTDIIIMDPDTKKRLPPGKVGEIWIRGPHIMKEYWNDPVATEKALSKDGWFRSGDVGLLDEEGFLYIRDRIKDLIIRGGENIDTLTVENAIYPMEGVSEVAAIGVPDERLGELVAVVVAISPQHKGKITEEALIAFASNSLPKFAVPVMALVRDSPLEHTPSGKIIKGTLRDAAREEWLRRKNSAAKSKL